jgi:integral membrane protein
MPKTNLGLLRIIGLLEGVSYVLLLFVAMPLKYLLDIPEGLYPTGFAHGLLFILYIIFVFIVTFQLKWNFNHCMQAVIASIIPFGTFIFDRKVLQKI